MSNRSAVPPDARGIEYADGGIAISLDSVAGRKLFFAGYRYCCPHGILMARSADRNKQCSKCSNDTAILGREFDATFQPNGSADESAR